MGVTCLVCGCREDEVPKMHYFPSNLERSRIWQEKLGMKFSRDSLRNFRICSKHFKRDDYIDLISYRLRRDAVPISFENMPSTSQSQVRTIPEEPINDLEVTTGKENINENQEQTSQITTHTDVTPSSSTKRTHSARRRLFRNIDNLTITNMTPRKKKLVKIIHKKEDQLRKLKTLSKKRLHCMKALSNLNDSNVVKNIFKDMTSVTANFMISQIRCAKVKCAKGRRWNLEDKILALCLFKRSPRCYSLLRKFVALPHKRTLLAMLEKVTFDAGINPHIFKQLNDKLSDPIDRCCALLFDEIDIQQNVQYDKGADRILGFEDYGDNLENTQERKRATKALVFMLVGLCQSWKQPVAFYFSHNGCNSEMLKKCIFDVLNASQTYAGVDVVTTICDMGVSNVKCLKELGVTVTNPFFFYEHKKIYAMYDPPHLLKCSYSLLRKHNVLLPVTVGDQPVSTLEARFSDITKAYDIDRANPLIFRTLHKIKATHLQPVMRYAMKVCVAAQILSHTMAAYLYSLVSSGTFEPRVIATATFVKEMDTLFDSFNGRTNRAPEGKELRCAVNENSEHMTYWEQAVQKVSSWTFKRLNKNGVVKQSKPPSQIGWLISLNAIRGVWISMKNKGATSLRPRSLNQDPLENLFGSIRYGCGCNDNPNAKQFIGSLKTQILNGLTNEAIAANCEEDDNVLLSNLRSFLDVSEQDNTKESEQGGFEPVLETETNIDEWSNRISAEVSAGSINVFSVAYVAGFILKGFVKHINCELCSSQLVSDNMELHNLYISNKEWTDSKNALIYPSEHFTIVVGSGITILESFMEKYASQRSLLVQSQSYLKTNLNFEWLACEVHKDLITNLTIKSVCKIGIPWWCKRYNQQIKAEKKESRANKRKVKKFQH